MKSYYPNQKESPHVGSQLVRLLANNLGDPAFDLQSFLADDQPAAAAPHVVLEVFQFWVRCDERIVSDCKDQFTFFHSSRFLGYDLLALPNGTVFISGSILKIFRRPSFNVMIPV